MFIQKEVPNLSFRVDPLPPPETKNWVIIPLIKVQNFHRFLKIKLKSIITFPKYNFRPLPFTVTDWGEKLGAKD